MPECIRFLERIAQTEAQTTARGIGLTLDDAADTQVRLQLAARLMLLESVRSPQDTEVDECEALRRLRRCLDEGPNGHWIRHDLSMFFSGISKVRTGEQISRNTLGEFLKEWLREHKKKIEMELLPLVGRASKLLLRIGSTRYEITDSDLLFLEDDCRQLREHISYFEFALTQLTSAADGGGSATDADLMLGISHEKLARAARRLLGEVVSDDSRLKRLIALMTRDSIAVVVEKLVAHIRARFAGYIKIEVRWEARSSAGMKVFLPEEVTDLWISNVGTNLMRWAFPDKFAGERKVLVQLPATDKSSHHPVQVIRILNNGEPLEGPPSHRRGGERVSLELSLFGAKYHPVVATREENCTVVQRVDLSIW